MLMAVTCFDFVTTYFILRFNLLSSLVNLVNVILGKGAICVSVNFVRANFMASSMEVFGVSY